MRGANLSKRLYGLFSFICVVCLFPMLPTVAEGQTLQMSGTWNFNSFVSGPSAPWLERGSLTIAQGGTFSGSGTTSTGTQDNFSGSFSLSSAGIVMSLNGQSATSLCEIDSGNTLLSCTQTWSDGSTNLLTMSKQAASSSLANLAGNWQGNILSAGPTASWERVSQTINSDGTYTGTYTKSDGTTGNTAGTLAITSNGVITCAAGDCLDTTYASFLDAGKTITVGTGGAATTTDNANLFLFTKQATSYSINNIAGTWQGNGLASGPGAPWWEFDTLGINQDGTCSFVWTASDGTSGSQNGTVSITSGGVITLTLGSTSLGSTFVGVMDANKTVMVFTNTWADGSTQEIRIFTNSVPVVPSAAPILNPTYGGTPLGSDNSQAAGNSTVPAPNTGSPAPAGSAPSNAGTTAPTGGSGKTESGQAGGGAIPPHRRQTRLSQVRPPQFLLTRQRPQRFRMHLR